MPKALFLKFPETNEMLNSCEGRSIRRLLAIDGKTQRGNGNKNQKSNHIVSAVDEKGFCLGQKCVEENTKLEDVRLYFSDNEFLKKSAYKKTLGKARGIIEKREYWKTEDISWLSQKKEWMGLKTIILSRNTIRGEKGEVRAEDRYFISNWMVESYHWHLFNQVLWI